MTKSHQTPNLAATETASFDWVLAKFKAKRQPI